eukprot:CAMPEP_0194030638 /NCGR_PEP_ID=MMETSP0009_2-20130614/4041_1 /TAXON_ID=210454 /ORGANISM="Grammatophora oceanica, Strain CCMP 410" /LENGTH=83 /DNA_ID=CAMNT_0038670613 /DNA_START=79 /DNA_END=330 /DNA_ORIENTATION=+
MTKTTTAKASSSSKGGIIVNKKKASCAICGKGKAVSFKEETMDKIRAHFGTKKAKDQKACRSCNMKMMSAARKAAAAEEDEKE